MAREAIKENINDCLHLLMDFSIILKSNKSDSEIKSRLEKRLIEYGHIGTIEHIIKLLKELEL